MKPIRPGPYIAGFMALLLIFVILFASGVIIISTDNVLGFKYELNRAMIGGLLIAAGIIALIIMVKFFIWALRRMATSLDLLFPCSDLVAAPHKISGRHYSGLIDNRKVDIYCRPVKKRHHYGAARALTYVGHELEIEVAANLSIRTSARRKETGHGVQSSMRGWLADASLKALIEKHGGEIINTDASDYRELAIHTVDSAWTQSFLALPRVKQSLSFLLQENEKCLRQFIRLEPGKVVFATSLDIRRTKSTDIDKFIENTLIIAIEAEKCSGEISPVRPL